MRVFQHFLILAVLPLVLLTAQAAPAPAEENATKQEIDQYVALVTNYYKRPDPRQALAKFMRIDWDPFLLKMDVGRRLNFNKVAATFYSRIVRLNPEQAMSLANQAAAGGMKYHMLVLARSIALSGVEDRQAALQVLQRAYDGAPGSNPVGDVTTETVFARLGGARPVDDLHRPITVPFDLDMMWAAFYASGDKAFVEKIARLLQGWMPRDQLKTRLAYLRPRAEIQEGPERNEMRALLTAQAAAASLRANARSHRPVFEVLDNLSLDRNTRAGQVAKQILQSLQ